MKLPIEIKLDIRGLKEILELVKENLEDIEEQIETIEERLDKLENPPKPKYEIKYVPSDNPPTTILYGVGSY